ncbi:MAG TPA: hypothetical protein VJB94_04125 [Candidatus Nanoarchaeia archaeon]|nr:hypothetical protein [Candidatus Nanoarchaeia archaeon]
MKNGQLLSQPFVYISALIIGALIIIFGARAIGDIDKERKNIELATFITSLRDNVNTYYNFDEGSSKKISLYIPDNVDRVCFYNKDKIINADIEEFFKKLLELDTINNVYLLPFGENLKSEFFINHLRNEEENPLCFDVKGRLNALIETKASNNEIYVEIKNGQGN